MTPEYAAERLLELGPLTPEAFRDVTGWPPGKAERVIAALQAAGVVAWRIGGPGAPTGSTRMLWLARHLPQEARPPAARAPARLRLVA